MSTCQTIWPQKCSTRLPNLAETRHSVLIHAFIACKLENIAGFYVQLTQAFV